MLSGGRLEDRLMSHKSICVAALLANAQAWSPALQCTLHRPQEGRLFGCWLTLSDSFYTPTTSARITSDLLLSGTIPKTEEDHGTRSIHPLWESNMDEPIHEHEAAVRSNGTHRGLLSWDHPGQCRDHCI